MNSATWRSIGWTVPGLILFSGCSTPGTGPAASSPDPAPTKAERAHSNPRNVQAPTRASNPAPLLELEALTVIPPDQLADATLAGAVPGLASPLSPATEPAATAAEVAPGESAANAEPNLSEAAATWTVLPRASVPPDRGSNSPPSAAGPLASPGVAAPASLVAWPEADGRTTLLWSLSPDDQPGQPSVLGYDISRAVLPGGTLEVIAEVGAGLGIYRDPPTALPAGAFLRYAIATVGQNGARSDPTMADHLNAEWAIDNDQDGRADLEETTQSLNPDDALDQLRAHLTDEAFRPDTALARLSSPPAKPAEFTSVAMHPRRFLELSLRHPAGSWITLESSADLRQWTIVRRYWSDQAGGTFTDQVGTGPPQQFYRFSSLPGEAAGHLAVLPSANLAEAGLRLGLRGQPGLRYEIQVSADLQHWVPIHEIDLQRPEAEWVDPAGLGEPARFYRTVLGHGATGAALR